jgi:hypothetical protein
MNPNRTIEFTPEEMKRLLATVRSLQTSYSDFIRFATMQALDEAEGLAREMRR